MRALPTLLHTIRTSAAAVLTTGLTTTVLTTIVLTTGLTKGKNKTVVEANRTKQCVCGAFSASQARACKECGLVGKEAFDAHKSDNAKRVDKTRSEGA